MLTFSIVPANRLEMKAVMLPWQWVGLHLSFIPTGGRRTFAHELAQRNITE